MKLFTKFKLNHERFFKAINLDWREVAFDAMNDLFEERKRRFMVEQENYDLKQELAAYKYKENFDIKARQQGEMQMYIISIYVKNTETGNEDFSLIGSDFLPTGEQDYSATIFETKEEVLFLNSQSLP